MIKFENTEVMGWEAAIRGMRNSMNSWEKSDSGYCSDKISKKTLACHTCKLNRNNCKKCMEDEAFIIGPNDIDLTKRLRNAGTDHRKFMRMIIVYTDITAPLYWWKEFDTYKVGTVANSCSTMHKIHAKEFTLEDFSCEHLEDSSLRFLKETIDSLNYWRTRYVQFEDDPSILLNFGMSKKDTWWQMIQLLPSSYNQKRTVMMNYEVLANIYKSRKNHKLDEWCEHKISRDYKEQAKNVASGKWGFCDWIKTLPYSELITGQLHETDDSKVTYELSD